MTTSTLGILITALAASSPFPSCIVSHSLAAVDALSMPAGTAIRVGPRIPINEAFPGLRKIHNDPDVFVVENFLDKKSCEDLIRRARDKGDMVTSPVAYAGWTSDFSDLTELAAKGPASWLAILGAWFQLKDDQSANQVDLVMHALQNFAVLLTLSVLGIGGFLWYRGKDLQGQRTSTSTTLDDLSEKEGGTREFVLRAADLFCSHRSGGDDVALSLREEASCFESPTVIRYEPGQVLAPHFDANRAAEREDANRGGQTLATLLVYLNDVEKGGLTRFGRLRASSSPSPVIEDAERKLTVQPRMGDALLFFPADGEGNFDERTEHEGCPAIDEKWIARIWRHEARVRPPFGLGVEALGRL